jgi:hypothetical protein
MGVRFNKRINILPWLKMNVGKSGISLTIGPKGKTLNVGSTGVSLNVSLGKGVGYNKRLITWKNIDLLSKLGLGTAAAKKAGKKGDKNANKKGDADSKAVTKKGKGVSVPTLDEAIAEAEEKKNAEAQNTNEVQSTGEAQNNPSGPGALMEQQGCSWGCAALGCLGVLIIIALLAVVGYLLWQQGVFSSPSA